MLMEKIRQQPKILFHFIATVALYLTGGALFSECTPEGDLPPTPISYVTLIYMAADNSTDIDVDSTINKIKEGAKKSEGTTVIYLDRQKEPPRLFSISQKGDSTNLKTYQEENSASTVTLMRVIRETKEMIPSDKFGLIFWSHSMGWVPYSQGASTSYIGIDETPADGESSMSVMEIDEIVTALPDHVAEYIWFDVCLMGGVESMYAFRNKATYLVGSPTEVLLEAKYDASGIPYAKVLPLLFGGKEELISACKLYYDHYNTLAYEILRSASIVLVDARELDGLYMETQKILSGELPNVEVMDTEGIQTYHTKYIPQVFFDLGDFIQRFATLEEYEDFQNQLSRTVIYKAATPTFTVSQDNNFEIDPARFSGLSSYIPLKTWEITEAYRYYFEKLEWSGVYDN